MLKEEYPKNVEGESQNGTRVQSLHFSPNANTEVSFNNSASYNVVENDFGCDYAAEIQSFQSKADAISMIVDFTTKNLRNPHDAINMLEADVASREKIISNNSMRCDSQINHQFGVLKLIRETTNSIDADVKEISSNFVNLFDKNKPEFTNNESFHQ